MSPVTRQRHEQLIEAIAGESRRGTKGQPAKAAVAFVREYYRHVPIDDIAASPPAELARAALSIWKFAEVRPRRTVLLRVLNPTPEEHGWSTPHTIVEIVNDDMPFLVDSVVNEMAKQGYTVHLVIHPVVRVQRLANGSVVGLVDSAEESDPRDVRESYIHVEASRQTNREALATLARGLKRVLADVRAAVVDWPKMRSRVAGVLEELEAEPPPMPADELEESKHFLRWLDEGHFTFLGYGEYRFRRGRRQLRPEIVSNSGLGLLRHGQNSRFDVFRGHTSLPADVNEFVKEPKLLLIGKGPLKSPVHRSVYLDMIGVKQFDDRGEVTGEKLFLGLFTATAYNRSPQFIPLLRRRLAETIRKADLDMTSHDGRSLLHILETFPRDDLFQISDDALLDVATGILDLQERHRTAVFPWQDPFERFISCLVYYPADQHRSGMRGQIQEILERAFAGKCRSFDTRIDQNSVLARIHYVVTTTPGRSPAFDVKELERQVAEATRSWSCKLQDALVAARGAEACVTLSVRYGNAFGGAYQETYDAAMAALDVAEIERVLARGFPGLRLYRRAEQAVHELRFRAYNPARPVPLSDALPILENLGFRVIDEQPFLVRPDGCPPVWIHDFGLVHRDGARVDPDAAQEPLSQAVARVWSGHMENDGLNRLVVLSGLSWRQVVLLRAYAKYLRQAQIPFSEAYMHEALAANPKLACQIVQYFESRFDPAAGRGDEKAARRIQESFARGLEAVTSVDEDRIIRCFVDLVDNTLRTNFYQTDAFGHPKPHIAIKLNSQEIPYLPLPRPMVEIFVYSPNFEGVHLRFGKVARGGVRWSDRREDYRTEVLGLVKAQQVKNTVIVPVGSKGVFVVKRPPPDDSRDAMVAAGVECYKTFIRGLLDVTDNYCNGSVVHPADVVCKDGDDPYLVVAADKGTATFSDIANGVAAEYGFWLGDAFASGGSAGYDHKKMGITARGVWESVKRHFRELDRDVQQQDFTVVGVGDMSGDVFGNGMLLSRHTKLVAAFNHLHIFVDPNPDPKKSYQERLRLFQLPRSSWSDYNRDAMSAGGAVFDRAAKSITLSPEAGRLLGINRAKVTPNALVRAILRADVELLWFGGIGTFVKARRESHADVGDRSNDAVRVDAQELRAKVVGEGANLGLTQLGRVEYALAGGRINTDSVDNSAGVDCSDHEVNIKILLDAVERSGGLTRRQRNSLLERMTDDVAELVLKDNYMQTGSLSVAMRFEPQLTDRLADFMRALERAGQLDRAIEFLPDDETLAQRKAKGRGFARPELCVLMAYAKIVLFNELCGSKFPDEPFMLGELDEYFPPILRNKYKAWIAQHHLRREIVATMTTNSIVNRLGISLAHELMAKSGKKACDIARGYAITRRIFDMRGLWSQIDALDNRVPTSLQATMHYETGRLIEHVTTWFLRHGTQPLNIATNIEHYEAGIRRTVESLDLMLSDSDREYVNDRAVQFIQEGAPAPLARLVAKLRLLVSACDIVRISRETGSDVLRAGKAYFAVGDRLDIDWFRRQTANLPINSHWDSHAIAAIVDDLYSHQYALTRRLLREACQEDDLSQIVARCCAGQHTAAATVQLIQEIRQSGVKDLAMLAVANRQLSTLAAE
ncbi:MAG: NAD-glutamate dehydrogenase [Planctomycetes bacterium]|nr:NAD-glutamate dehydrogenase [Planctomycetota bacterium]